MEENTIVQQEEFTFRKFFALVKKSGKRILVYAIIAAIVGACLAVIVGVNTIEKKTYSTTIEYTHKGIEKGLAPDGTVLNPNMIKSSNVINAALKEMAYDEAAVARIAPSVEDAIAVVPYISSAVAKRVAGDPTYEYIPTRYTLSLRTKSISEIKSNRYPELLNSIAKAYRNYFKETYKYDLKIGDEIGLTALNNATDYYDLISIYNIKLDSMSSILSSLPDYYSTVVSSLKMDIYALENQVMLLENYILTYNVSKKNFAVSIKTALERAEAKYEQQKTAYSNQIVELNKTIEGYAKTYTQVDTSSDGGATKTSVVSWDTTKYNELVSQKTNLIKLISEYEYKIAILQQKKGYITTTVECTDAERSYVEENFSKLYSKYVLLMEKINDQVAEYTEAYVINNGVKVVNPASAAVSIGWVAVVATFAVTVLIGVVVAIIVTSVKTGKVKNQ